MKTTRVKILVILPLIILGIAAGQTEVGEQLTVNFTDPGRPGTVDINVQFGNIHVTAYGGNQVIIDSEFGSHRMVSDSLVRGIVGAVMNGLSMAMSGDTLSESGKSTEGMYKIPNISTELRVEEEDNVMEIRGGTFRQSVDLEVQVPYETSLKLRTMGGGSIRVENVRGEIDANAMSGGIDLQNVTGPVLAHSMASDIVATFRNPISKNPMSFTTMSGDIDVTFPANLQADLKFKSQMGEIFTDYKVNLKTTSDNMQVRDKRSTGGSYQLEMEKIVHAVVNNGGTEIKFNTFTGDIFIRKAK